MNVVAVFIFAIAISSINIIKANYALGGYYTQTNYCPPPPRVNVCDPRYNLDNCYYDTANCKNKIDACGQQSNGLCILYECIEELRNFNCKNSQSNIQVEEVAPKYCEGLTYNSPSPCKNL